MVHQLTKDTASGTAGSTKKMLAHRHYALLPLLLSHFKQHTPKAEPTAKET